MARPKKTVRDAPFSIRLPAEIMEQVKHAARLMNRTIMGTGLAMLRHHYNDPQFRADAEAFWKLLPDDPAPAGNIVAMA